MLSGSEDGAGAWASEDGAEPPEPSGAAVCSPSEMVQAARVKTRARESERESSLFIFFNSFLFRVLPTYTDY